MQAGLETLYRLEPAPAVSSFILDARTLADGRSEQLYIREGDDLELGLSLDPRDVELLRDQRLAEHNLPAFCLIVEGISHFLLVVHRARQQQPTSAFELELQAEVDKYVAALLLTHRSPQLATAELRDRLYQRYELVDGLSSDEAQRYHQANGLARRYAQQLEHRFVRQSDLSAMVGELRWFYRLSGWAKHGRIGGR